ncbi:MAG: acyl-CoA thioesterase [Steroidobacteraceae bacterium]
MGQALAASGSGWDLPAPHVVEIDVEPGNIDEYGHVNNAVYLQWLDRAAWSHSASLGIPLETCVALRRGMAAHHLEIDYERAGMPGDRVQVATWIVGTDRRLRVTRRFQLRRAPDGVTLARARTDYVCMNLDSGRAARMPALFLARYREPEP